MQSAARATFTMTNPTPRTIPPTVTKSGNSLWSKSIIEPTIISEIQIHITGVSIVSPYFQNAARNRSPPNVSMRMYRGEIGALQFAHLPRRASHERIGMFWYHLIAVLHFGQCDGGLTIDSPRGTRQMTTLRNEAMHAPSPKLKAPRMTTSPSMPHILTHSQ